MGLLSAAAVLAWRDRIDPPDAGAVSSDRLAASAPLTPTAGAAPSADACAPGIDPPPEDLGAPAGSCWSGPEAALAAGSVRPVAAAAGGRLGVVVTAVIMDVVGEWRARHGRELRSVWPLHRVYAVDPALARLAAAGITAYPRGVYLRTLLQFFGPWVPVELLVPEDRAAEAEALLTLA